MLSPMCSDDCRYLNVATILTEMGHFNLLPLEVFQK